MVTHLTTSVSALWLLVVQRLGNAGYSFNILTTTPSEFLAVVASGFTGQAYSNLTSSVAELLAAIANGLEDGGGGGGQILLSDSTISEGADLNDVVGTLSVPGTTGTPVFALDYDAGGLFALNGANVVVAADLDFETEPSPSIVVSVSGVTPSRAPTSFIITITDVSEGGVPGEFVFSSADNSGLLALLEDI